MAGLPTTLVAQRGNAAELPANTLPALESALALGVHQLFVDVQLASDALPMVVHGHEARREGADHIGWIVAALDAHAQLKCGALQPQFLCIDAARLPPPARPWRGPWQWAALDVPTPAEARRHALRGFSGILTPRVRAMARELGLARMPRTAR